MYSLRTLVLAMVAIGIARPVYSQQRVAQPAAASSREKDAAADMMRLTLKKGLELKGMPVDLEEIKVNTLFGEATIPTHTIAGIRFAQSPGEQTTVVLLNGDALTGELALTDVKFVSDWGEAKVNVAHLVSIVFRSDFAWSGVNTPNGRRWRLTKVPEGQNQFSGNRVYTSRNR